MLTITRRNFLKSTLLATSTVSCPTLWGAASGARISGANEIIRVGVVGLGATDAVGGVGGRGHQLIGRLKDIPGIRIAALCDVDPSFLERELKPLKDRGEQVATYSDIRKMYETPNIDAVVIALPNHWHGLATVWACQAGKDVYVEKPFSHNLWEGRQMVAAARKYSRMVQVGTQNRSSSFLRQVFEQLRGGALGRIRFARAIVYRPRDGIGKATAPAEIPAGLDYDLWCGPAPKHPLKRRQLHYEWHWFWETGNGELGNNGVHMMDLCRWAMGSNELPRGAMSIAGRFGFDDDGETANTHIALLELNPAPLICEIRNLRKGSSPEAIGKFRGQNRGLIIDCEGGYFAGDASGGAFYDTQGKKMRDLPEDGSSKTLEKAHLENFFGGMRSRNAKSLAAEADEGHLSAACCHLPNISHRLGKPMQQIQEAIKSRPELSETFERCREYLAQNGVDLQKTPATLGPWVTFDSRQEKCVGEFGEEANRLLAREYRKPFVVPL